MRRQRLWIIVLLVIVAGLVGCGQANSSPATDVAAAGEGASDDLTGQPTAPPMAEPTPAGESIREDTEERQSVAPIESTEPSPVPTDAPIATAREPNGAGSSDAPEVAGEALPVSDEVALRARRALAQQLSAGLEDVEVVDKESVEWSDASLGCPEPGTSYAQVVTPGYRITMEVAGERYEYHSDAAGRFVICTLLVAGNEAGDSASDSVERAKQELAQRLGVEYDSITLVAVLGQQFSAQAFYCKSVKERVAKEDAPEVMPGQTILLEALGRRYEYHANAGELVFCRRLN